MSLPPYANILLQYQKSGIQLDYLIFLYIGENAWHDCKQMLTSGQYAMCLPYDRDVTDFEWPITGLKICIVDTGGMTLDALRRIRAYLLLHNPEYLHVQTDLR